jgi:hypothetical protein
MSISKRRNELQPLLMVQYWWLSVNRRFLPLHGAMEERKPPIEQNNSSTKKCAVWRFIYSYWIVVLFLSVNACSLLLHET